MDTTNVIGMRDEILSQLNTLPVQSLVHDSIIMGDLWHRRLAHINYRALQAVKNIVTGIPMLQVDHDGTCRRCALGKNVKRSFPDSESKSKGILDLVHSDLCGPMTVASLGGYHYYVTLINDYSRKTWIYFLKTKESKEILSKFKEFKAQLEYFPGNRIKILRSDNGGEYTSIEFNDFCKEAGIKRELTVPYSPKQN